jgi:hypothetical protein
MASKLLEAISGPTCTTYSQVLAKLTAIEAALDERDGLRWFTRLYREMTTAVSLRAAEGGFQDPAFLELLDCVFAELYFAALAARLAGSRSEPHAWRPLFDARADTRLSGLQFALAGVNAHINRDLPVALVACYRRSGSAPVRDDARHDDYRLVNRILAEVHGAAKSFLFTGELVLVDQALGQADDHLQLWSLARARDAAWIAGEVQWQLRNTVFLADQHLEALDRLVGLASRSLLQPALVHS